ncbi:MAG TPA: HAD family phosphatase [Blastocatellia bacterium]|nr:HAD family phosphatase [Blastocatellia bacterium]
MLRAIVLDFNGVIADDEHIHFELLRDVMAPLGLDITQQDYLDKYIVYRDEEAFTEALKAAGREPAPGDVERLCNEKRRRYINDALSRVQVFPGACDFVRAAARQYPLAIASAAARPEIEAVLRHIGIRAHFNQIVAAEDVARGKPEPDVYIEAVRRLALTAPGIVASEVLAVEDTPGGIASARAAGLRVAAVLNTFPANDVAAADIILEYGLKAEALDQIHQLLR